MKRILLAVFAATLLGGTAAYAAPPPRHAVPPHHVQKPAFPTWRAGQRLSKGQHWNSVSNYQHYHLRKPGRGQQWVHVNNQYLLVNILTGLIAGAAAAH